VGGFIINLIRHSSNAPIIHKSRETSCHLTIPVGKHGSRLYHTLTRFADSLPPDHLTIMGWTPLIPQLLRSHQVVICKAGGAILHEVLAARIPAVIDYVVPGQEEGNAELLLSHDCALRSHQPDQTASAVRKILEDEGKLAHQMKSRMIPPLSLPDAAFRAADAIRQLLSSPSA
jgi:processive 1,2-diacylglycerol beta-glucosyltransferase